MDSPLIFPALAAGRFWLTFLSLPEAMKHDNLLSSPLTSNLHLQEGLHLFKLNGEPYAGGVLRHSPLYLSVFSTILPSERRGAALLWTACDVLGAWALVGIWRTRTRLPMKSAKGREPVIAASYLLNPYIFLPTLALSTSSVDNALILVAILFACRGRISPTLLTLSILTHLSVSVTLLLPPLLLLLLCSPQSRLESPRLLHVSVSTMLRQWLPLVVEYVIYTGILACASTAAAGGWSWVHQSWTAAFTLPDLTPNCGLWWYFFTEMFDHFRSFFLMVFSIHLVIYMVPICIKFQHDPLYAAFLMLGVLGTFKSYPTLSDPGLFISMISLFPETYPYLRHPFVTTFLHLHAALLMPLFRHLWLSQGMANANFFYASTMVFGCANAAALIDCVWAGLRIAIRETTEGCEVVQE